MPEACVLGVNNASSSFNRCKETTGFLWKMYHSEVKTGYCSEARFGEKWYDKV